MSMISRYKKQGGFEQLLILIEGCNKKKQDQLIGLVESEDLVWAERIRAKMLTVDRLFAFPPEGLAEIFSRVPEKVLVFALHGVGPEKKDLVLASFNHFKKKSIDELMAGSKPKPSETESAFLSIFKLVRDLDKARTINIEKLMPELSLREDKAA